MAKFIWVGTRNDKPSNCGKEESPHMEFCNSKICSLLILLNNLKQFMVQLTISFTLKSGFTPLKHRLRLPQRQGWARFSLKNPISEL